MKVGIVGGGLFGATAAVYASRAGHDVHLFESRSQLMVGATAGTYSRIHRGQHYPRSPETGRESRRAEKSFRAEYGAAVIDGGRQFYVVPPFGSRVSVEQYRQFLDNEDLPFSENGGVFEVSEPRVDLSALQVLVRSKVAETGLSVHLETSASRTLKDEFDQVVVAAYAGLNNALVALGCLPQEYKYQVVERPVVLLPESFRDTSIVVVDGPFGSVDPLDDTPLSVLGHVVNTIHAENVGYSPDVPDDLAPLINQGLIRNCELSRWKEVVDDLSRYVPEISKAVYVGSSFTVRAVLAHVEDSDKRPTIVQRHDAQTVSVFSGKLGTACKASTDVVAMLETKPDAMEHAA